jgi:hypothetical protein
MEEEKQVDTADWHLALGKVLIQSKRRKRRKEKSMLEVEKSR